MNTQDLKSNIVVERVTVSCALTSGRKGSGEFVSLTVRAKEGDFTLEEAHIVHKMVSAECTEMAYMDALARSTVPKEIAIPSLKRIKGNYEKIIAALEKSSNI